LPDAETTKTIEKT